MRARVRASCLALALAASQPALGADREPVSGPAPGHAPGASASPAATTERVRRGGAAERRVEARRQDLETRARGRAKAEQQDRVALQIPAALRQRALQRIDARIERNLDLSRKLRREALGMLGKLLAELPEDASEMPPTLMRLGELEWEEARERFLADFARWERTPSDQRSDPPVPDYGPSRARFARVLERYPSFERYDLALYVDGFLASEEGKMEEALQRVGRILVEYPRSRFVPDAHMVRAEAEFARASPNHAFAYQEYEAVLALPDSGLHDLALFKSAWALWRMGQTEEAARRFLRVFRAGAERGGGAGGDRQQLAELQAEALKNLVAVFVEDENNTADDMHRFLVQAGGERFASEIVRALAEALYDQTHYTRGIEAYRLLIRLDPTSAEAPRHALAIALGHSTLEMWAELERDYAWILEEYVPAPAAAASPASVPAPAASSAPATSSGPGAAAGTAAAGSAASGAPATAAGAGAGSAWLAVQDPATLTSASEAIERRLYEDALGLHAKAQEDRSSRVEFEAAAALYAVYLRRFGTSSHAYDAYFNLGEIHFHHLGNPALAAEAYLAAVRLDAQSQWSRTALYNALEALESAREAELRAAEQAGKKPGESPLDQQLTRAMELYSSAYPDDPELPELLFRQGRLYYDHDLYDPAVRQWGLLLERHGQSPHARAAGELILDSFNKAKDYENIEVWGRRLLSAPAFAEPSAQGRLSALIVQAIFKQGEQQSAAGEHARAGQAYLRAALEFPRDGRAAQAAVNATIEGERAVDADLVRQAADLLGRTYTQQPEAARGLWVAANLHQSLGLLAEAARYHETLATHWPKDEHHKDALFDAVLLYATLGQRERAVATGTSFQKRYASDPASDEVTFLMGKAHEQAQDFRSAESLYARYSSSAKSPSRRIEALVRLAVARVELGDDAGARAALERAVTQHKSNQRVLDERGKYFGARASFMQAQRILADFEKIQIEGDVKLLSQRLERKAELLKRASSALLETAKLGVAEWTTASLYQVGSIYESFARSLVNAPAPANLTAEQAEEYRMQIDEFVVPIEEKSIEAYESGWNKAVSLGIFNSWTAKMREALGRLNGEAFPPLSEVGFRLRSETGAELPALIGATRRTPAGASQDFLLPAPTREGRPATSASPAPGRQRVSRVNP